MVISHIGITLQVLTIQKILLLFLTPKLAGYVPLKFDEMYLMAKL